MSSTFSNVVKEIISLSREEALRLNSDYIGIEHVLLALIKQGSNSAVSIMNDFHVNLAALQNKIELAARKATDQDISGATVISTKRSGSIPLNVEAEKILREAAEEAKSLKSKYVEAEHLILSALKHPDGISTGILNEFNLDYDKVANRLNS